MLTVNVTTKHPAYEHESEIHLLVVKEASDVAGVDTRPHRNGVDQLRFVRLKFPARARSTQLTTRPSVATCRKR